MRVLSGAQKHVNCFDLGKASHVFARYSPVAKGAFGGPVAQPIILFGRGQTMTSSVTDVFITVENWYKAPVHILAGLFQGTMVSSASFWLRHSGVLSPPYKAPSPPQFKQETK